MIYLLDLLDGKKTIIGGLLLFIAAVLAEIVVDVWGYSPWWMENVIQTLNWFGVPLYGVGLGHKYNKFKSIKKLKQP